MKTDTEILDFIEKNQAQLTYATSEPKRRKFRCYVHEFRLASPDIRERSGRVGFGETARKAIDAAMSDKGLSDFYKERS